METVVITSESDLKRVIREAVREELREMIQHLQPEKPSYEEPLLTRKQMANYLNISLPTLAVWVRRGLPCIRKGSRILFLRSEVLAAIKARPVSHKGKK
jgi:excisionase family DNA binding protein